jgi:TonB family protein
MARWYVFVCVGIVLLGSTVSADSVGEIVASLEKHTVVLRNYYTDSSLSFDKDGKPVSAGTSGFGPTDGQLYIDHAKINDMTLTLAGMRPVYVWNAKDSAFHLTDFGRRVNVQIQVPNPATPETIAQVLNQVFLNQSELQQIKCADTDTKILGLSEGKKKSPSRQEPKLPDAQTLSEATTLCFPGGERAYRVGRGVKAPKAIHAPDPEYSDTARRQEYQGTAVLALIVDTSGRPSTIVVTRPLGYGLDEHAVAAIKRWTFKPATFHGQPVAVGINVEMNFRLY